MQHRRPGAKTTEVQACVVLVCASTDDGRLLTGGTNLICRRWSAGSLWVADYAYQKRQRLARDFSVKLSPYMCSHVRLMWLDTYIYLWW